MKVGIVMAHPDLDQSRANRAMWEAVQDLSDVQLKDLYSQSPNFYFDVAAEQKFLSEIDVLVLQHPVFWYHMPALLKHWIDEVFTHGWAYGTGGEKLKGKYWLQSITLGGPEHVYQRSGHNKFTVHEFLRPHEQTAYLCQNFFVYFWHIGELVLGPLGHLLMFFWLLLPPKHRHYHQAKRSQQIENLDSHVLAF